MGFWGSICSVGRAIGRGAGKCIETVGNVFNSEKIKDIGRNIQNSCSEVSVYTGETESYNKESARIDETERINKILSDFSLSIEKKADIIEENIIKESNVYFMELIDCLNDSEAKVGMNINGIKREMRNAEKSIRGNLKKHIAKRVSIDDRECLEILKMESGKLKEDRMRKFSESILKEGLDELVKDIRCIVDEEETMISEVIHDKLKEINFDISKKIETFNLLEKNENQNESQVSKIIQEAKNKILLSETIITSLK